MRWIGGFFFVLIVFGGLNFYVGARMLFFFQLRMPWYARVVYWLVFFTLAYSYVFGMLFAGSTVGRYCRLAGGYWMVLVFYLVGSFLLVDVIRLAGKLLSGAGLAGGLSKSAVALAALLAVACSVGAVVYGAWHARDIRTAMYHVSAVKEGPPGRLRIALITDLHLGSAVDAVWLESVVAKVNESKADLVCIAGDIFDNNLDTIDDVDGIAALFRQIEARYGVYACLGNHDVEGFRRWSTSGAGDGAGAAAGAARVQSYARIEAILRQGRVTLLQDEVMPVNGQFYIAGRRDYSPIGVALNPRRSSEELALTWEAALPPDWNQTQPFILLDHQPRDIQGARDLGADLLLSGHTHKGQIFPGNLVTRYIYQLHYGYRQIDTTHVVVSSGAGVWGPPIRIGTNSEVALIDFEWQGSM